jgi:hypothetical protein
MAILKGKNDTVSPERAALARAVMDADTAQVVRNSAIAAEAPARDAVWAAEQALRDAQEALATAKADAAGQVADALVGNVVTLPVSLKQARAAVMEAEDHLEFAIAARDALNARRYDRDGAVQKAGWRLDEAVDAVIRAEARDRAKSLAADLVRLHRETAAKADELMYLIKFGAIPLVENGPLKGQAADDAVREALNRMDPNIRDDGWGVLLSRPSPSDAWIDARAALKTNASAELPIG